MMAPLIHKWLFKLFLKQKTTVGPSSWPVAFKFGVKYQWIQILFFFFKEGNLDEFLAAKVAEL